MQEIFGPIGAQIIAAALFVSSFGCNNGLIPAGARVYCAMVKNTLLFRGAGRLHPTYRTPAQSLVRLYEPAYICLSLTSTNL